MADVRALLKAKRQEARVNHPLASYSSSGQLRCSACGTIVKHGSAWEGHLGSKAHRTTVARLKEEERIREEQKAVSLGKRKAVEEEDEDEDEEMGEPEPKKAKPNAAGGFPADFFSDPTRAPPPTMDMEDEPGDASPPDPPQNGPAALDDEWARFQSEVVNAPDFHETYESATVFAEPVMAPEVPEGFPPQEQAEAVEEPVDEEELRRRKAQEERELIMDRLMDEERAQEDADMKVTVMKNKLDAIKKRREAAKALKHKSAS
ncbi:hypothetical protein BDZ89DRAFT_1017212 [Hymenopellis radicata]|nr:hypothetical protein BDZ89DRAFT_1017212 [Hymenopellis radicata]